MKDLLTQYLFRLKKTKSIWILRIVCFVCRCLVYFFIGRINEVTLRTRLKYGNNPVDHYSSFIFRKSRLLGTLSPENPYFFIVLMCISQFITADWKNRTFRTRGLAGKNRSEIYFSGALFGILFYLIRFLILLIPYFIFGYSFPFRENFQPASAPTSGSNLILNLTGLFFTHILLLSSVIAISYIVHNGVGFRLPYALAIVLRIFVTILQTIQTTHNYTRGQTTAWNFYPFLEFLPTYQINLFGGDRMGRLTSLLGGEAPNFDSATRYIIQNGSLSAEIVFGRTVPIRLKNFFVCFGFSALFIFLGNLSFKKADRK